MLYYNSLQYVRKHQALPT